MTRSASVFSLGSEFDNFLYAPIGDDKNGMLLSVLSALARLDVDPWEEAAKLAQLSEENATRELASLIAAVPNGLSSRPDPGTVAPRLIALLPRRVGSLNPSSKTLSGVGSATHSPIVAYLIYYVIFIVFVLVAQWVLANRQASTQSDKASTTVSTAVFPQTPPSNAGR